ncbi:MAG TPA: GNAT family N-acetyltransferase [Bacteroidota bacterium]|nr:GNAT family N-acetyltransferase [Bacteroidota bacterium]
MPRIPSTTRASQKAVDKLVIRPFTRKDGKDLLLLIDALADFEHLPKPTAAARQRLLRDAAGKRKRFDALLAFAGPKAVGYAILFETYSSFRALPTLYLEDIFVLPEFRQRHIGGKLFRACLKEARDRKCGRMEWVVLDWNINAIEFYRHIGAHQLNEWLPFRIDREQFASLLRRERPRR